MPPEYEDCKPMPPKAPPEMTLRALAVGPPINVLLTTPSSPIAKKGLGRGLQPVESVLIKLPWMTLPEEALPVSPQIWMVLYAPSPPAMTFFEPGAVPPIVFSDAY